MEPNGSYVGWLRGYNVSDVTLTGGGTLGEKLFLVFICRDVRC